MKIAIIGGGQIGSRHAQSLLSEGISADIEIVEPSLISAERLSDILSSCPTFNVRWALFRSIDELSLAFDVLIVATSSDVRFKAIQEFLQSRTTKHMILEKVLFQTRSDYFHLVPMLEQKKIGCWVNHPRRMFPFYQNLKARLLASEIQYFGVTGGNWGLACNGLHFLDLFEFLSGQQISGIDGEGLHSSLYPTKRLGFVEFMGEINAESSALSKIKLSCIPKDTDVLITIKTNNEYIKINEKLGVVWENEALAGNDDQQRIVLFQSELTLRVVQDLLNTGRCQLPNYHESMRIHLLFIDALMNRFAQITGQQISACPVT